MLSPQMCASRCLAHRGIRLRLGRIVGSIDDGVEIENQVKRIGRSMTGMSDKPRLSG
jgi:hypothetical protein